MRIYALAKELKIDSKQLVDVCAKAGVTGKGSALANLDDDEIAKVKAYLSGGKGKPTRAARGGASAADQGEFRREDYIAPVGTSGTGSKIRTLPARSRPLAAKLGKAEEEPASEPPVEQPPAETAVEEPATSPAETPAVETPPEPADPPSEPAEEMPAVVAETPPPLDDRPIPPPVTGRPRPIEVLRAGGRQKKRAQPRPQQKKGPVIKLPSMPNVQTPQAEAKTDEPTPQKPIMTLPKDAIRGAKAGADAPLQAFTKQQDKRHKTDKKRGKGGEEVADDTGTAKGKRDRRRGKAGEGEKDTGEKRLAGMAGGRSARQHSRRARRSPIMGGEDGTTPRRMRGRPRTKTVNTAAPRKEKVALELPCTLRAFSEASGVPTSQLQQTLMGMGTMATINASIDAELAELLATELEIDIELKQAESLEDSLITEIVEREDDPDNLAPRPPIVTFLGHVDHGKTSLLDRLINIDVVSGEAGGITQHIRAYTIDKDGRKISFVDTPGHAAFTEMRARGANVTDIAVLVVAADDGVMPQTEEAISHARAAEVPIIVAMNKIDMPAADPDRVYAQLSEHNLLPVEWGGDVEVVKTSAITGEGLDDLLETILLTADLQEYQANPKRDAYGTCLEAHQEAGRGVVAKFIVRNGTLKVGDIVVCGEAHGRIKAMFNTLKKNRKEKQAGPSISVNITGLDTAPDAGESFYVLDDIAKAREIAVTREHRSREESLSAYTAKVSFIDFQDRIASGDLSGTGGVTTLNLILRADVRGSIEAIQKELGKLDHPEVQVRVLQASVGGVTVADVTLASASNAVVVGFNVIPDEAARQLADERGVEIRRYDIIYKLTDDLRALLEGKLRPEERVKDLGRALVQQVFSISRVGAVAGCRVLAGTIERGARIRVNRDGRGIGEYPLDSLRREKDDAREVREGYECGMKLAGFNDLKEGDILEAFKIEEVARKLEDG